jgi:hypothetical protein
MNIKNYKPIYTIIIKIFVKNGEFHIICNFVIMEGIIWISLHVY